MATITSTSFEDASIAARPVQGSGVPQTGHDHGHVVSWSAVFAGAVAAAALSLILLVLGVGLGLSSVSPWTAHGASAAVAGVGTIVWILVVAILASGMGGYLSGRLRGRWAQAHIDEVYFRDTAHGFLAWAVATLLTAGLLTSTIGSVLGAGADAGGAVVGAAGTAATTAIAGGASAAAGKGGPGMDSAMGYVTDSLFRPMAADPSASASASAAPDAAQGEATVAEAGRIFAHGVSSGSLSAEDSRYVGELVAKRTGLAPADAEKRVTDTFAKSQKAIQDAETTAKDAADKARKAGAYAALWIFVSLLSGAFAASLMATVGGRRRDL